MGRPTSGHCERPSYAASFQPLLLAAIVSIAANTAEGMELRGTVDKVVDGDTFLLCVGSACHKIVNAPEKGQAGYREASDGSLI